MGAGYGYGYPVGSQPETGKDEEKEVRKGIFSKVLIALIVAANVAFAVAVLVVFCSTYSEPSTLIMAWFGFTTGELWALAFVKKKKLEKGENKDGTAGQTDSTQRGEETGNGAEGASPGGGTEADPAD